MDSFLIYFFSNVKPLYLPHKYTLAANKYTLAANKSYTLWEGKRILIFTFEYAKELEVIATTPKFLIPISLQYDGLIFQNETIYNGTEFLKY